MSRSFDQPARTAEKHRDATSGHARPQCLQRRETSGIMEPTSVHSSIDNRPQAHELVIIHLVMGDPGAL